MHNIIKVCLCVWKEWLFVLQCKSASINQSSCTSLCACLYCVGMSFLSNKDKSTLIIMPKPWSTPAVMHDASHTPLSLTSYFSLCSISFPNQNCNRIYSQICERTYCSAEQTQLLHLLLDAFIPLVLTKSVQCIVYCWHYRSHAMFIIIYEGTKQVNMQLWGL